MRNLRIYTDGSCPGNPGPAGWGFVVTSEPDPTKVLYEKFGCCTDQIGEIHGNSTNQIAEIMAFEKAFAMLLNRASQKSKIPETVEMLSDSAYVLNCFIEGWYLNWRKYKQDGIWLKANKEPVVNQWLWEKTIKSYEMLTGMGIKFTFTKVKAHIKPTHKKYHPLHTPLNERADYLAGEGTKLVIEFLSTK